MMQRLRSALGYLPAEARPLIAATAALAFAAEIFAYAGPGRANRQQASAIMALADQIRSDDAQVARRVRDQQAPSLPPSGTVATATSDPLPRIDAAVAGSSVHVMRLAPRPTSPGQYDVELDGSFDELTRFAAAMEGPGSGLRALQIRQAQELPGRLIASFVLSVTAAGKADPQPAEQAGSSRDPFALVSAAAATRHRLTGVTRIGERLTATIDGKDYTTGDSLGDVSVVEVREDEVVLQGPAGQTVLGFTYSR